MFGIGDSRVYSNSRCLKVVLTGEKGLSFQRNSSELLAFPDDIDDGLVTVGLEIPNLQVTEFGLSQSCGEKGEQNCVITFTLERFFGLAL